VGRQLRLHPGTLGSSALGCQDNAGVKWPLKAACSSTIFGRPFHSHLSFSANRDLSAHDTTSSINFFGVTVHHLPLEVNLLPCHQLSSAGEFAPQRQSSKIRMKGLVLCLLPSLLCVVLPRSSSPFVSLLAHHGIFQDDSHKDDRAELCARTGIGSPADVR
jgi:hypothetical protein